MNIARFNGSLHAARIAAQRYEAELERVYADYIRRAGAQAARSFTAVVAAVKPPTEGAPDWQLPPEGVVSETPPEPPKSLLALHAEILTGVAAQPLARLGVSWTVAHPLSQALLDASAQRTGQRLGEAVQPIIRETVLDGYQRGLSVIDTAALITEKIADATAWQARMLARTDLNSLANGGSVMAAQMVGVQHKQWLTAEDDRVRETHAEADGQVVPIDAAFQVGGELLDYPGDPTGSDAETANCRCTVIYLDPDEALEEGSTASSAPPAMAVRSPVMARWVSDLAFEGAATEDGRYILPDALTWRDLPLTLMGLLETGPGGHQGAFVAGRIDQITRSETNMDGDPLPDGQTAMRAEGVFDVDGEFGAEVARLVEDETVRGVSIDMAVEESVLRDPETGDLIEIEDATEDDWERVFMGELQQAVRAGSIMAATVCPTPAFADARIAVTASGRVLRLTGTFRVERDGVLTASAAGLAPAKPPAAWFETPEPNEPTPLTVTADGQVFGHIAAWGVCHTGRAHSECFTPPTSPSGYRYFNLGAVECDDGSRVACGQITLDTDHAPLNVNGDRTRYHYEHTGTAAADVRAKDGRHGIWVAGAVRPKITDAQARALMAAKPSGDWRSMTPGGPLELIGVLAVNVPGFPVPRTEARLVASAAHPDGVIEALIAVAPFEDAALERRMKVLAARAEGGIGALAELAGVA